MKITYNIIDPNPDGEKTVIAAPFRTKWLWSEELVELRDLVDYGSDYVLVIKWRRVSISDSQNGRLEWCD